MTLRVVVIGTGYGQHAMAPAYADLGCRVDVVSPRDPDEVRAAIDAPCDLVSAHSPPFLHRDHVEHASTAEDAFTAMFGMEGGFTAVLDTGFASSVTVPSALTAFGTDGAIRMTDATELEVHHPGEQPQRYSFEVDPRNPHQSALGHWLAKVCRAVVDGEQIEPNLSDGAACAEVMDALRDDSDPRLETAT